MRQLLRLFLFIVESCECLQSYKVHKSMSAKSAMEKMHKVAKEKEV